MVTLLDSGISQYLTVIFSVLLVFAVVFALLYKTKILGENFTVIGTVSVVLALLSMLSSDITQLITFIAPWFVVVFIFLILLLLIYHILGATGKEGDVLSVLRGDKTIQWVVLGVALVILFAGGAHVFGQRLASASQGGGEVGNVTMVGTGGTTVSPDFNKNVLSVIFSPAVLGLIFVFVVAIFAVVFLSGG